ncbi:WW domain-containing protein wwm1 [Ascochyta rabiei]|uniref:WW domain-containing protein wwm1 n=1 Tax=Didymella rabiei TaxID=5454 RepID=UPI0021FE6FDC|nr:WW domain-containing protein wwm1 [Ascochyta rabiei]UPX12060.1 WW domain-containing protein wwm1 [Ascochyta rabiei]
MNGVLASPMTGSQGGVAVPPGWKAEWSAQYTRYFYVNLSTNQSTWVLPSASSQQLPQSVQRKPVPNQGSQSQTSVSRGSYTGPQPQNFGGYFAAPPAQFQPGYGQNCMVQQQQQQQQQSPYQQPYTPHLVQQQPHVPAPPSGMQQFSPPPTPGSYQEQQRNFTPPNPSPATLNPQYPQQQQNFGQPFKPEMYNPGQSNVPTPPLDSQQTNYMAPQNDTNVYHAPPPPPQSQAPYNPQHQQQKQLQQNYYPNNAQPQQQIQAQQSKRSSSLGSSLMGGSMMTKMSSKLTQFQKPAQPTPSATHTTSRFGTPATAQTDGKHASNSSDWKKWGKRAAIGVAAVGALALGVDAMDGGIFDGAATAGGGDFGGGGDFSGGDWAVGDAQTSLDASAAQAAMEQQGQENALMLLDPPGTTCKFFFFY